MKETQHNEVFHTSVLVSDHYREENIRKYQPTENVSSRDHSKLSSVVQHNQHHTLDVRHFLCPNPFEIPSFLHDTPPHPLSPELSNCLESRILPSNFGNFSTPKTFLLTISLRRQPLSKITMGNLPSSERTYLYRAKAQEAFRATRRLERELGGPRSRGAILAYIEGPLGAQTMILGT